MSIVEYISAAIRHRAQLKLELATLTVLGLIVTYHAMKSPLLDWLAH
jgi:hypothetical protein